ncbi:Protein AIM2-like protein 3 [Phlyctema vagabunda]|uniref:Protein AIM2-like protein 3 n=1 Tax=Phlyctema vagabunda TaxID=108571 RepID=A0ABR4PAI5_9HELO
MSCPDCFRGGISKDDCTGKWVTIHGLRTYVAEPESGVTPKGLIVYITDAFGPDFVNNRVLCDRYARGDFLVYCPDLMNGRAMSPSVIPSTHTLLEKQSWFTTIFIKPLLLLQVLYHVLPWMITCSITKTEAEVIRYFHALRTSPPPFETKDLKIGTTGFCWGGKHTLSSISEPLIDAAFVAHPTFIKVPDDVEAIRIPISWAVGEEDLQMKAQDVRKVKDILESRKDVKHEVQLLPGAKHGFANRTDPDDEVAMAAATRVEEQAKSWFSRWFP